MELKKTIEGIVKAAKDSSMVLAKASTDVKNRVLDNMAKGLRRKADIIIEANKKDIIAARRQGLSSAFIDRLTLNKTGIDEMADSIKAVAELKDPCGVIDKMWKRPNGLIIGKMRVPIGVIGIIYESRPNVTADCAGLCIKSGNAVILKGGKESINSNIAIYTVLKEALRKEALPEGCIGLIESTERKAISYMLKMDDYIDLIIPRGGEGLIKMVTKESTIPVIKHYKGVCHVYVDADADIKKAINICINAKVQRPGVCNAMETMLVDEAIAEKFLPVIIRKFKEYDVEIRGCRATKGIIKDIEDAKEQDWYEEYLDLILAVRVVKGVDGAIAHINKYGSRHSDAIVTEDFAKALKFLKEVDSACVYNNASTRFTDGYQFGFGAEIGISTDKIHARGPMALEELTTYKYIIFGNGQIRR
jgi:glutamate-5-semialdehyde dehydrogenase